MAAQQQRTPPAPGAAAGSAGGSVLLQRVAADGAVWATALLPRLVADGTARQLALACRELRALVHGAHTRLAFNSGDAGLPSGEDVRGVPQHFRACRHVVLVVRSEEDYVLRLPQLLEALGRLPQLASLQLKLQGAAAEQPAVFPAQAVQLVRLQLTALRSLQLSSPCDAGGRLWRAIGLASQLTRLELDLAASASLPSLQLQQLSALSGLRQLQHLSVPAWPQAAFAAQQDYAWLGGLASGLTCLVLPLVREHQGLAAIGALRNLQQLMLPGPRFGGRQAADDALAEPECAALAELTQVTQLLLTGVQPSSPAFAATTLPALQQLEHLYADCLPAAVLPALAGLTRLSSINSRWAAPPAEPPAGTPAVTCLSVRRLYGAGAIPFEAFPQLQRLYHCGPLAPRALVALARHCSGLTALVLHGSQFPRASASFAADAPAAERVAAVRGLSGLAQLRALQLSAGDDAEVGALAACTQLTSLRLAVPPRSACTAVGLTQLGLLQHRLCVLVLELHGLALTPVEARALLVGLQRVQCLTLRVESDECLHAVQQGAEEARALGLPLPARLAIERLPAW